MKRLLLSEPLVFILILIPALLFWSSLLGRLYPIHLAQQIPFFFDLMEVHKYIPQSFVYIFGLINYLLIWMIARKIFKSVSSQASLIKREALIPLLVFSLSPWPAYLIFAGSFYVYLLSLLLFVFLGLLLIRSGKIKLGTLYFIVGSVMSLYSSLLMLIMIPISIALLVMNKLITLKQIKVSICLIILFCLPLFISMIKNPVGLKNIYNNQVMVFSDPGLSSASNQFQGESKKEGFRILARLSENKYVYISKFLLLKSIKNMIPATFFTPQEHLLIFSFSPPILFGFLVPFLYGLYLIFNSMILRKYLLSCLVLIIPSFLSKSMVDLNRLILVAPIIIFIISFGLINLAKNKNRFSKAMLFLSIVFVLFQFWVVIFDINLREYPRYERSLGGRLEIEKQ